MTINARTKGAAAEREFAAVISRCLPASLNRNLEQARSGGYDLIVGGDSIEAQYLSQFAIEVKRYKQVTDSKLNKWWNQSVTQAQEAELVPMLAYRINHQSWRIVVALAHIVGEEQPTYPNFQLTVSFSIEAFVEFVRSQARQMFDSK